MAQQVLPSDVLEDCTDDEPSSIVEDDFSVSQLDGDTANALAHLRTRLLDLTLTNKLLNFKEDGPRVVRVIDELPDQLFRTLREGARLELVPLPPPAPHHPLRSKPRGEARAERTKALAAYAAECGLSPSFELPMPNENGPVPDRHSDDAVQTLMLPEELEKKLRAIASDAKSAIEEKGSNILYAVFGFLEWYESASSDKRLLAPLVMLPVTLEKGELDRKTGTHRFYLSYSDEDILPNLSLQEKLRADFGMTLPELEDDDTPEAYLARVQQRMPMPPRWCIRRQVSLGLLGFAKLFMYRDLDPKNWPEGSSPADHPRIADLFRGPATSFESAYAPEYDFESNAHERTPRSIPPIIVDADSSQHSAIVDVMAGRSLVIEGPPGTGKSQTIANIVAAGLADGKTVLFVADKLTALEVVRRRLDEHGLGAFCLELHSDKAQKSKLMNDIRARKELRGTFRDPAELDERLRVLEETKARLNRYATLMGKQVGKLGWTVHAILWGVQRRRSALGPLADPWHDVVLDIAADAVTLEQYETLRNVAAAFERSLREVRSGLRRASEHPFWGAWPSEPRADLAQDIVRCLTSLDEAVREALERQGVAERVLGAHAPEAPEQLASYLARVAQLEGEAAGVPLEPVRALETAAKRTNVRDWCAAVTSWRAREHALLERIGNPGGLDLLRRPSAASLDAFRPDVPLAEVEKLVEVATGAITRIEQGRTLLGKVGSLIGEPSLEPTVAAVSCVEELVALAAAAPLDCLAKRPPPSDEVDAAIDSAEARALEIQQEHEALEEAFHLELVRDDLSALEQHAATCASAGFFAFLSGAYRAAKRQFLALSRSTNAPSAAEMAARYKELVAHRKKRVAFEQDAELRRVLGAGFAGLATNFESLRRARAWQRNARELQRRHRAVSSRLADIAVASIESVQDLADLCAQPRSSGPTLSELLERLSSATAAPLQPAALPMIMQQVDALRARASDIVELARAIGPGCPASVGELVALRQELLAVDAEERRLSGERVVSETFGPGHATVHGPLAKIERCVRFSDLMWSEDTEPVLRDALLRSGHSERFTAVRDALADLRQSLLRVGAAHEQLSNVAGLSLTHWYGESGGLSLRGIATRTSRALAGRDALPSWLSYLRARIALSRAGADRVRDVLEGNFGLEPSRLADVIELVTFQSLAAHVSRTHPELGDYEGFQQATAREQFKKYDLETMRLRRERMAWQIDSRPVPEGVRSSNAKSRTELALLEHELGKQRAHIPIRQLINRAGGALRALKPCFMMSPRSVAQYLQAGRHEFDLVVMDEASQLRPEDAVGAIARGKQLVIVGDSKQLPPTSFFTAPSATDEDSEEEFVTEGKESILDLARTTFAPARQLRWHYRSRHGSLIAFSNRHYYDDKLIVFPSPAESTEELGVRLVEVTDGVYGGSVNLPEAERVTAAVLEHLRTRPNESFGVVAMNIQQKQKIDQLVFDRLKDEPPEVCRRWEGVDHPEPPFVKNLESVQGDERDVIYISVTYGPATPGGKVARRFGPLNGAAGWRRLNVLFTRAKKRVVVFASFAPEDLERRGEMSRGAADLCNYLAFARTGILQTAELTGREPDSDFEVEVADVLRNAGYEVVPQVGVAGYFIDLAVRHPRRRNEFLVGIECDGAAYHSSFSARDRDRLRQQVLEGLGWKVHRIWSTDWFRDGRAQRAKLIEAVKRLEAESA